MSGQPLSEIKTSAEIAAIALKGYKESAATKIIERIKKEVPEAITNASTAGYINKLRNLTGPRTLEGRMRSLGNLTSGNKKSEPTDDNPITLLEQDDPLRELLLNDVEVKVYQTKKAKYEEEFKFNYSSDQLVLEQILLEEINLFRSRRSQRDYNIAKAKKPTSAKFLYNPQKDINDAIKNIKTLVEKLAVDRKQRTGGKDSIGDDVASLSLQYEDEYTDSRYENSIKSDEVDQFEAEEISTFIEESDRKRTEMLKKMDLI